MARSTVHAYYFSTTKRAFDVLLGSLLLILLSPLLLVISTVIFLTSGRPIIFHQQRLGRQKKSFTIYKFRVMYQGAEKHQWRYRKFNQAPGPMYKNWDDPRYVGIGKWLSKTGLDELPQLINIVKGEMSFIGPRPLPIPEATKLDSKWDFRYAVKPGVFSEWSKVNNRHYSLNEWRSLEAATVKKGGLWYELKTIVQTIGVVLLPSE